MPRVPARANVQRHGRIMRVGGWVSGEDTRGWLAWRHGCIVGSPGGDAWASCLPAHLDLAQGAAGVQQDDHRRLRVNLWAQEPTRNILHVTCTCITWLCSLCISGKLNKGSPKASRASCTATRSNLPAGRSQTQPWGPPAAALPWKVMIVGSHAGWWWCTHPCPGMPVCSVRSSGCCCAGMGP